MPIILTGMKSTSSVRYSIVPVLYVGRDLSGLSLQSMQAQRIGVVVADTPERAGLMLRQFSVAAVVFAAPDLPGLTNLSAGSTPVIVLAGRDAACDIDGVTIVRRDTDPEDLAAVIHGLVSSPLSPHAARDAA